MLKTLNLKPHAERMKLFAEGKTPPAPKTEVEKLKEQIAEL